MNEELLVAGLHIAKLIGGVLLPLDAGGRLIEDLHGGHGDLLDRGQEQVGLHVALSPVVHCVKGVLMRGHVGLGLVGPRVRRSEQLRLLFFLFLSHLKGNRDL